jgi:adenylate kinase family enzyme
MRARMQRIVILGPSGSGKSRLARAIGAKLALPVVHLDALFWNPGWIECETPEFQRRVAEAHAGERWVSEGNYSTKTWPLRLPRADLVLSLWQPRGVRLRRVLWRSLSHYGRTRADLGPDCPEHFDFTFYQFVWEYERRTAHHAPYLESFALGDRLRVLRGDGAVRDFLKSLG